MTLYTLTDPEGPEQPPGPGGGQPPVSYALRAIGKLLEEAPLAHEQFQDARHDRADANRLTAEAAQTAKQATDAGARVVAERHKAGQHKEINRTLGTTLAISLALLDALPAYWSAAAFNLDQRSTLVLTVLLCAALGGAMWLLDLFSDRGQRLALRILALALGGGFAAL